MEYQVIRFTILQCNVGVPARSTYVVLILVLLGMCSTIFPWSFNESRGLMVKTDISSGFKHLTS